jgi:hypothetical protein
VDEWDGEKVGLVLKRRLEHEEQLWVGNVVRMRTETERTGKEEQV